MASNGTERVVFGCMFVIVLVRRLSHNPNVWHPQPFVCVRVCVICVIGSS